MVPFLIILIRRYITYINLDGESISSKGPKPLRNLIPLLRFTQTTAEWIIKLPEEKRKFRINLRNRH